MSHAGRAALLAMSLLVAACGAGAPPATASSSATTTASRAPTPTPSPPAETLRAEPSAAPPSVAPRVATSATVAPAPPPPVMPMASTQSFALLAEGDRGARGSVTVTVRSGRATISVVATGLPAGSLHSVHLHFGNCPSAGSHILVLGTLRADVAGNGTVTGVVNAAFTGAGHFVIVYVGPSAGPLGACANVG